MGNSPSIGQFFEGGRHPPLHGGLVVAAIAEALFLHIRRWRLQQQHEGAVGVSLENLTGPLHLDHQNQVPIAVRWVGHGRAVAVAVVLRPLEEAVLVDVALERRVVDKYVCVRALAGTGIAGGPRTREDEAVVFSAQEFGDRVLSDPTGAGDDDDQGFGWSSRSSSLAF